MIKIYSLNGLFINLVIMSRDCSSKGGVVTRQCVGLDIFHP